MFLESTKSKSCGSRPPGENDLIRRGRQLKAADRGKQRMYPWTANLPRVSLTRSLMIILADQPAATEAENGQASLLVQRKWAG